MAPVLFWHIPNIFGTFLLSDPRHSRLSCIVPVQVGISHFSGSPSSFQWTMVLETKIWVLCVLITTGLPLLLSPKWAELGNIDACTRTSVSISLSIHIKGHEFLWTWLILIQYNRDHLSLPFSVFVIFQVFGTWLCLSTMHLLICSIAYKTNLLAIQTIYLASRLLGQPHRHPPRPSAAKLAGWATEFSAPSPTKCTSHTSRSLPLTQEKGKGDAMFLPYWQLLYLHQILLPL